MRLELHDDIEERPPYTILPNEISDEFRSFSQKKDITLEIDREQFRVDKKPYDIGWFQGDKPIETLEELIAEWNQFQRTKAAQ